jgi:hypothetical protein
MQDYGGPVGFGVHWPIGHPMVRRRRQNLRVLGLLTGFRMLDTTCPRRHQCHLRTASWN